MLDYTSIIFIQDMCKAITVLKYTNGILIKFNETDTLLYVFYIRLSTLFIYIRFFKRNLHSFTFAYVIDFLQSTTNKIYLYFSKPFYI